VIIWSEWSVAAVARSAGIRTTAGTYLRPARRAAPDPSAAPFTIGPGSTWASTRRRLGPLVIESQEESFSNQRRPRTFLVHPTRAKGAFRFSRTQTGNGDPSSAVWKIALQRLGHQGDDQSLLPRIPTVRHVHARGQDPECLRPRTAWLSDNAQWLLYGPAGMAGAISA